MMQRSRWLGLPIMVWAILVVLATVASAAFNGTASSTSNFSSSSVGTPTALACNWVGASTGPAGWADPAATGGWANPNQATVTWTANQANADGYQLLRGPSTSGPFSPGPSVSGAATATADDTGLSSVPGAYAVKATHTGWDWTSANSTPLSVATSCTSNFYTNAVGALSPGGWWRMRDTSGTTAVASVGTNGTYGAGVGLNQTPGPLANDAPRSVGVDFSTSGSSLYLPNNGLTAGTGDAKMSVSLWVRWDGTNSGTQPLFSSSGYRLSVDGSGRLGFSSGNGDSYATATALTANTWQQVVAMFANGTVTGSRLYVDSLRQTLALSGTPVSASWGTKACVAGVQTGTNSNCDAGAAPPVSIGEVTTFGRELAGGEIDYLYAGGSSFVLDGGAPGAPSGLELTDSQPGAGQWNFDSTLSWTASSSTDVVGYDVWLDGSFASTASGTSLVLSGLDAGSHSVMVRAHDGAGNHSVGLSGTVLVDSRYRRAVLEDSPTSYWRAAETSGSVASDTQYRTAVLDSGAVGYWRLGESSGTSATDSSGGGHTGTYSGSPTIGVPGSLYSDPNTAATFNGTNQYMTVGDFADASVSTTGSLSVGAVVKPSSLTASSIVAKSDNTAGTAEWQLKTAADGSVSFVLFRSGATSIYASASSPAGALSVGRWATVAASFDGTTVKISVGGVEVGSSSATTGSLQTDSSVALTIGQTGDGTGRFAGTVDEVALYPSAMTSARVTDLNTVATTGTPSALSTYSSVVASSSPVGFWRLGEASGTTMADSSGNARDGSYFGSPTLSVPGALDGDTNTAVGFNGTSQYATVPDNAAFDIDTTGSLSVEAWVRAPSWGSAVPAVSKGSGSNLQWSLGWTGTQWSFAVSDPSGTNTDEAAVTATPTPGSWYHLVGVDSGSALTLYVNGAQVASDVSLSATPVGSGTALRIARSQSNGYAAGGVDDVAVYPTALSWRRVVGNWHAGRNSQAGFATSAAATAGAIAHDTNQASSLNGTSQYLRLPASTTAGLPASGSTTSFDRSLEAWFQTTDSCGGPLFSVANQDMTPGSGSDLGSAPMVWVGDDGKLYGGWTNRGSVSPGPLVSSSSVADGAWHHVVLSYSSAGGGVATLSLDGSAVGSQTVGIDGFAAGYNAFAGLSWTSSSYPHTRGGSGCSSSAGWWYFNGALDEVAVYDSSLSASRVSAHKSVGVGAAYSSTVPSTPTGLAISDGSISDAAMDLSWSAVGGVAGYRVYRDGLFAGATSSPAFSATGLAAGSLYRWTVTAYSSSGIESPASSELKLATRPAPATLSATAQVQQASLGWSPVSLPGSDGNVGFYALKRDGTDPYVSSLTSTSYTDINAGTGGNGGLGLTAEQSYDYQVAACNQNSSVGGHSDLCSAWSAIESVVPMSRYTRSVIADTARHTYRLDDSAGVAVADAVTGAVSETYSASVTTDTPVGWWKLGESSGDAADSSANANTGVWAGTPSRSQLGARDGDAATASGLGGSFEHVAVGGSSTPTALRAVGDVTVEAWVRPQVQADDTQMTIVSNRNGATWGSYNFWIDKASGTTKLAYRDAGSATVTSTVWAPVPHRWYHVAMVRSNSNSQVAFYVDGSQLGPAASCSCGPTSGAYNFRIGSMLTGSGDANFFGGGLQDVAVYGAALSGTRIGAHKAAGRSGVATASSTGITYSAAGGLVRSANTAMSVNGTSGSLRTSDIDSISDLQTGNWTGEIWFKASSGQSGPLLALNRGDATPGGATAGAYLPLLYVGSDDGKLYSKWDTGSVIDIGTSGSSVTDGNWHHAVVTLSQSAGTVTGTLYLDGTSVGQNSFSAANLPTNAHGWRLLVGTTSADSTRWAHSPAGSGWWSFSGSVDELSLYPTALTSTRVAAHHAAGSNPTAGTS